MALTITPLAATDTVHRLVHGSSATLLLPVWQRPTVSYQLNQQMIISEFIRATQSHELLFGDIRHPTSWLSINHHNISDFVTWIDRAEGTPYSGFLPGFNRQQQRIYQQTLQLEHAPQHIRWTMASNHIVRHAWQTSQATLQTLQCICQAWRPLQYAVPQQLHLPQVMQQLTAASVVNAPVAEVELPDLLLAPRGQSQNVIQSLNDA